MLRHRRLDRGDSLGNIGDVGLYEAGLGARSGEVGGNVLAAFSVAPDENQGGTFAGGGPSDAGTETLSAAADQDHLPRQEILHHIAPVGATGEAAPATATLQHGLATAAGSRPSRTSTTPVAAAVNVAAVARRLSPIRWGVRTTSGWSNSGWCCGGSGSNTWRPIPAIRRATSAWNAASLSMRDPRPQLMRMAPGLVRPSVSALIRWWVSGVSGRGRVMMSLRDNSSASESQLRSAGGSATGSWARTFIPRAAP